MDSAHKRNGCRALIDSTNISHNRLGDDALQWGIEEFNLENRGYEGLSTSEGSGVHSFVNGQFFAEVLGICMKYNGTYCCSWSMYEHGGRRKETDYSFLDGQGLTPRPSYRHMELIAKNFTGQYADGATNLENIRAFGCFDDTKLCALILNMEAAGERQYSLRFDNEAVSGDFIIHIDAEKSVEYSDKIPN